VEDGTGDGLPPSHPRRLADRDAQLREVKLNQRFLSKGHAAQGHARRRPATPPPSRTPAHNPGIGRLHEATLNAFQIAPADRVRLIPHVALSINGAFPIPQVNKTSVLVVAHLSWVHVALSINGAFLIPHVTKTSVHVVTHLSAAPTP